LNSDDLLTEGSLAFVMQFFADNTEVDVIYGHRIIIDELDREVGRWILPPHNEYTLRRRGLHSPGNIVLASFAFRTLGCFRVHPAQKTRSLWNGVGENEVASLRARQGVRQEEIDKAVFRYRRAAAFARLPTT
jgi:hypothetical protein